MKDKEVFNFKALDCEKLAYSLGLANAPQIGFIQKSQIKNQSRNANNDDDNLKPEQEEKKLNRLQRLKLKIKEKKEQKKMD